MPSGLAALLDDVATITKMAAASVDDIAAAAGNAQRQLGRQRLRQPRQGHHRGQQHAEQRPQPRSRQAGPDAPVEAADLPVR